MARRVVGDHGVNLADSVLERPGPELLAVLRQGHRHPRQIRRLGGDDRSRRIHHHHEFLGLRGQVGNGKRLRGDDEPRQNIDVVAHDEFLREALGGIRRSPGVAADDLDLPASHGVAVLLHVKLDAIVHLRRRIGELARIGHDQADLDGLLSVSRHKSA